MPFLFFVSAIIEFAYYWRHSNKGVAVHWFLLSLYLVLLPAHALASGWSVDQSASYARMMNDPDWSKFFESEGVRWFRKKEVIPQGKLVASQARAVVDREGARDFQAYFYDNEQIANIDFRVQIKCPSAQIRTLHVAVADQNLNVLTTINKDLKNCPWESPTKETALAVLQEQVCNELKPVKKKGRKAKSSGLKH